ncbi:MAG: hypothetical protein ACKVOI_11340, partial [Dongiaceae bacterium]
STGRLSSRHSCRDGMDRRVKPGDDNFDCEYAGAEATQRIISSNGVIECNNVSSAFQEVHHV